MASVLLDLDDVAYIDDSLENIAISETEERRNRLRRNQILGDPIVVNINQAQVQELLRDRRENQVNVAAKMSKIDKDYDKLIQCLEQEKDLQELRKDREKSLKLRRVTESKKSKENKNMESSEKEKRKSKNDENESRNQLLQASVEDGERSNVHTNESYSDTDKILPKKTNPSKVCPQDRPDSLTKGFATPSTSTDLSGKLTNDDNKVTDKKVCKEDVQENGEDQTDSKYQRLLSDSSIQETAAVPAAEKQKNFQKATSVDKGSRRKKKNPYQIKPEDINKKIAESNKKAAESTSPKSPKITITITDENGEDGSRAPWGSSHASSSFASSSQVTTRSNSINPLHSEISSTPMTPTSPKSVQSPSQESKSSINFMRQMSEDNDHKKTNNILMQQELYKQETAKPFQKFAKVKTGLYEVGIEGDAKQSYVKGIVILEDGRFVIYDKNNRCLKLFDKEFNPLDKMVINVKFCGITAVKDNTIAASMPELNRVQTFVFNAQNKIHREQTLPLEAEIFNIAHFEDKLYTLHRVRKHHLTENDDWVIKKFDMASANGELKLLRTFNPGCKDIMLLANPAGLYMTNRLESEVLLMDHDGNFKFRHKVWLLLCFPVFKIQA